MMRCRRNRDDRKKRDEGRSWAYEAEERDAASARFGATRRDGELRAAGGVLRLANGTTIPCAARLAIHPAVLRRTCKTY